MQCHDNQCIRPLKLDLFSPGAETLFFLPSAGAYLTNDKSAVNDLIPIILSGGTGSRLWPLSRSLFPKQLLALAEGRLDLGFCRLPAPKGWQVLPVVRAHFVAVLPAGYQGVAGLADLQEKPLAILRVDPDALLHHGLMAPTVLQRAYARYLTSRLQPDAEVAVRHDPLPYVSRGGLKLEAALETAFGDPLIEVVALGVGLLAALHRQQIFLEAQLQLFLGKARHRHADAVVVVTQLLDVVGGITGIAIAGRRFDEIGQTIETNGRTIERRKVDRTHSITLL